MRIRGRKPTSAERKIISAEKLDTYSWLVVKSTSTFIEILHRETGEAKQIEK